MDDSYNFIKSVINASNLRVQQLKISWQGYRIAKKKQAGFLFDLGIVSTTDDDCEHRFRPSHSVYNSWQHRGWDDGLLGWQQLWSDTKVEQEAVVIFARPNILYVKRIFLQGCLGKIWMRQQNQWCPPLNGAPSCLVYPWNGQRTDSGRTTDERTDDGPTSATIAWSLTRADNKPV